MTDNFSGQIPLPSTRCEAGFSPVIPHALAATALQLSGVAAMQFDAGGRVSWASPALFDLTGYDSLEELNLRDGILFQPGFLCEELYEKLARDTCWLGECAIQCKSGVESPVQLKLQALPGVEGCYVAVLQDLRRQRADQERICRISHHDALTGLPNWVWLSNELPRLIAVALMNHGQLAVLRLDLNRFRAINDAMGERVGDGLIVALAGRLSAVMELGAFIARRDGDEFCIILPCANESQAMSFAAAVLAMVAEPIQLEMQHYELSASIGISLCPQHGSQAGDLMDHAGTALHAAKRMPTGGLCLFRKELTVEAQNNRKIEQGLQRAIRQQEFHLCFQPQTDVNGKVVIGVEALLRWRGPEGGLIPPSRFIPVAEQTGQIIDIGRWVLEQACMQGKAWFDKGFRHLIMSVNLSPRQFRQDDLVQTVCGILTRTGFPPHLLMLEITEGALMDDPVRAETVISRLHAFGVNFSLDDFGTGYSSLGYLKRFSLHQLKIDRSFVEACDTDFYDRAIISSIIGLAGNLGLQVVAEGVETEEQLHVLRQHRCGHVQGFLFSQPLEAGACEQWLKDLGGNR